MRYVERRPGARLQPWVEKLWALSDAPAHARERIVPNGTLELVINLHEDELRIYPGDEGAACRRFPGALVSGAYDRFFGIDTREHAAIIGVHFAPAGASAVLGVPAGLLRNAHVELEALWGLEARALRDQLCEARGLSERFTLLERALCAKLALPRAELASPRAELALGGALAALESGAPVAAVAALTGLSHRRFIEAFVARVGMTPKVFGRVRRFQRALTELRRSGAPDWAALAARTGYYDQSHLIREFVEFSGLAPSLFLRSSAVPVKEHHVAVPASG